MARFKINWWRVLKSGLSESFWQSILLLVFEQDWKWKYSCYDIGLTGDNLYEFGYKEKIYYGKGIMGTLDRLMLIVITIIAIVPWLPINRETIGLVGIGLLIIIY